MFRTYKGYQSVTAMSLVAIDDDNLRELEVIVNYQGTVRFHVEGDFDLCLLARFEETIVKMVDQCLDELREDAPLMMPDSIRLSGDSVDDNLQALKYLSSCLGMEVEYEYDWGVGYYRYLG